VVLVVVLLALGLSYVFPLRVYLAQQAEIAQVRAAQDRQRAHVEELAAETARWSDDDFLRIQARKRLYFGEPDELLLVVSEAGEPPETGFDPDAVPAQPGTWWDTLWTSVRSADSPTPEAPTPGEPAGTATGADPAGR
jgi:hypothetical protein